MAILGLMGAMNVGKTSVLKIFVDYVEKNKIEDIEGGVKCNIQKKDFKGESDLKLPEDEEQYTKTITPNKVVFTNEETGESHTLFAPGGDKDRAVIRMGIITISRIARQVVGLFSLSQGLKTQFKLYDLIRYMPKEIYVCLNKYDLFEDDEERLEEIKEEIKKYFTKRRIKVKGFFQTCAINKENYKKFNDNAAKMILDIALGRV